MDTTSETSYVLHAKSNLFHWEGTGQLSIKTFQNGIARYKTNKGYFAVETGRYLLLNQGQYTISIEQDNEVESFCLFFKKGLAEDVAQTNIRSQDSLLSDPYKESQSIEFFEKTYDFDTKLSLGLNILKMNLDLYQTDLLWREEQFHKIMRSILKVHKSASDEVQSVKALRYSTREEIYRRLTIAHEFVRAFYTKQITLEQIAAVACLSPNHLLRNYSDVFGRTPHQHITEMRLLKAKQLLQRLEYNMTDISFEIGFNNPASFNKLFKKHIGTSPLQYRKKVIMDKN